jgi:DNA-binding transcriptional LysR family regulator
MQRGSLSIGGGATATTYLLPALLGRFHARYAGIRFFVREQPSQSVVENVLDGQLDLGVVTLPINMRAAGSETSARLEVEEWVEDEMRLIVPPGHALHSRHEFEWSDLAGEPLVLFEAGSAVRGLLDHAMSAARIDADIVMELRSIESIKQMVAQGIGSGFVSQFALSGPRDGLRCVEQPIRRKLAVIYRNDRTQSPAARAFLGMMRD